MAIGKNLGANSQSSNDFLEPSAPVITSVTNVGASRSYNNGAVTVAFQLPANSPEATSYTASAYCSVHGTTHTATGATSPLTITGLGSDMSTTVTVVATNAAGSSAASAASDPVTITTVPGTPGAPSVSSPAGSAGTNSSGQTIDSVSWTAPASGGVAISQYTWTSSDGKTGTTTSTSVNVGQEGGTAQTYSVRAENSNGVGSYSSASGSVTTFSFTPFSFVPFGFVPFGAFSFTPFSFVPFGAFAFTPFNFAPFGFTPFGAFAFTPFNFSPAPYYARAI